MLLLYTSCVPALELNINLYNWVLESLVALLNMLYSLKTHPGETNKMLWTPKCNHGFEVELLQVIIVLRVLSFSLEEHMEGEGSTLNCFLYLDGCFGQNPHD